MGSRSFMVVEAPIGSAENGGRRFVCGLCGEVGRTFSVYSLAYRTGTWHYWTTHSPDAPPGLCPECGIGTLGGRCAVCAAAGAF